MTASVERITPLESDEYDPLPPREKIADSNVRIAVASLLCIFSRKPNGIRMD